MMPPWQMIMDMIPTIEHNNEFTPSAPFISQVYEKYALIAAAFGGHLCCVSAVGASWIAVVNMFLGSTAKGFLGMTWKSSLSSNAHLVVRYLVMNDFNRRFVEFVHYSWTLLTDYPFTSSFAICDIVSFSIIPYMIYGRFRRHHRVLMRKSQTLSMQTYQKKAQKLLTDHGKHQSQIEAPALDMEKVHPSCSVLSACSSCANIVWPGSGPSFKVSFMCMIITWRPSRGR